jgi:hypothetical protein
VPGSRFPSRPPSPSPEIHDRWASHCHQSVTNLAAGFFNLRDSKSGKTVVKLSSNEYWSARMWFCWISASHNPASRSSAFGVLLLADQLRDGNRQAMFRRQPL